MRKAKVLIDRDFTIGYTDPRLFGAFIEHLGRCVYGGIYEPSHRTADARGFRKDVLALVKELGPTLVRYPGGNFVSGYNWEDGVGPPERRPARLDLAWFSTEPNSFGTNEFMDWCRAADIAPMMAVNLGTRGGDAARNLVEYCNHPGGTAWSELRRKHGWQTPHGIKLWCLGNEMDGPWQIEQKSAAAYGAVAREAAKMMRRVDPTIELAVCGSSLRNMPSFGQWEETVLEHTFDYVDYISIHTYLENYSQDTASFLASTDLMDSFIEEVVVLADAVAAKRRSKKRLMLSFDEWNVWYRTRNEVAPVVDRWPVAPPILEQSYTMEDALAFGGACISLLNHADRVRIACLAQLVNVIAPIMTKTGGGAWRQTIFFPFAHMSRFGRGMILRAQVETEAYYASYNNPDGRPAETFPVPDVPYLKIAAVAEQGGGLSLFLINRDLKQEMEVSVEARSFGPLTVRERLELRHDDLMATNTENTPDKVKPAPLQSVAFDRGRLQARLKPASWNVIYLDAD
ncbi:arabinosylfuranosidase ArfA [Bradyrhizobium sp. CCBAU 53415]|uniref:arabinosylfuranosidase ArfA n=1 Tax=Bradyrhizobium sp. CCBAU 53415 TaxID=1325119 RepID=UPI002306AE7B|nr:alpha-N-arabinofuranosidase [Bradyrhizobium sp. CCBAU 53415]MDA9463126.1 alpha-N-arabinofuranosidase [Bradyrhizobium sp. CCBAU 53415]